MVSDGETCATCVCAKIPFTLWDITDFSNSLPGLAPCWPSRHSLAHQFSASTGIFYYFLTLIIAGMRMKQECAD
jgi:hypothetical protein